MTVIYTTFNRGRGLCLRISRIVFKILVLRNRMLKSYQRDILPLLLQRIVLQTCYHLHFVIISQIPDNLVDIYHPSKLNHLFSYILYLSLITFVLKRTRGLKRTGKKNRKNNSLCVCLFKTTSSEQNEFIKSFVNNNVRMIHTPYQNLDGCLVRPDHNLIQFINFRGLTEFTL